MQYIKRQMEESIIKACKSYPVIMVCGQRQCGKSTMLRHISDNKKKYITFDDFKIRELAKNDPELFFEIYGKNLLIDEFQRVPSILLEIKKIVDNDTYDGKNINGSFLLTGSQNFQMIKDISETLAGRVAIFNLLPLSEREINSNIANEFFPDIEIIKQRQFKKKSINEVYERIFAGSMPKLIADKNTEREFYYSNYVNTYIEKDINSIEQIGKLDEFRTFMIYMAANTSRLLKYESISKFCGVSSVTIKNWISILMRSGIIYLLYPYSPNISRRMTKMPKCYFLDTGLASYLSSFPTPESLRDGNSSGEFLESYVISEILKGYYNKGKKPNMYFYRDCDQREIDLVFLENNKIYPVEIKRAKNPDNPEKNFKPLERFGLEVMPGVTLCMSDELFPLSHSSYLCPISVI